MYQEEVKPNPAILKKYILTGEFSPEWVIRLYGCPNYSSSNVFLEKPEPIVLAVYHPTGRVFIEKSTRVWEYEYGGVRISS